MKKLKKIMSVALSLVLVLGLSACSSKKSTKDSQKDSTKTSTKDLKGTTLKAIATSEYKEVFEKFTKETGIKVETLSMSSGEAISRIKAEGGKPMADLWFGGGIDAFIQAKKDGLLEKYVSPEFKDIPDKYKDKEGHWVSKGITIVGFIVNKDVLKEKNLQMPKTWQDLTKPEYKGEVLMSNPAISGTNYGVLCGLLENMGEEKGWEYFKKLNENITAYSKRGKDPQVKTVAGEAAIGITYIDKSITDLKDQHNVEIVYPEDGLPWIPEGVGIFKNASNVDAAKAFLDWIFKKDNMEFLAKHEGKDGATSSKPGVKGYDIKVPKDKLFEENFAEYGKNRKNILAKWADLTGNK